MTFDENVADREPPEIGRLFYLVRKISCFSVLPLCPLCLSGFSSTSIETTEAQRTQRLHREAQDGGQ